MTARAQFVADQLAAAIDDAAERFAQTPPGSRLTARQPAAAALVDLLEQALPDLTTCRHLDPRTPTYSRWAPGWAELRCTLCAIAAFATTHDPRCDLCRRPSDGDLTSVVLTVGPIAAVMIGCTRCRNTRKPAETVDLRAAARRVTGVLMAHALGGTA